MTKYRIVAVNYDGYRAAGEIEAASEKEAEDLLRDGMIDFWKESQVNLKDHNIKLESVQPVEHMKRYRYTVAVHQHDRVVGSIKAESQEDAHDEAIDCGDASEFAERTVSAFLNVEIESLEEVVIDETT